MIHPEISDERIGTIVIFGCFFSWRLLPRANKNPPTHSASFPALKTGYKQKKTRYSRNTCLGSRAGVMQKIINFREHRQVYVLGLSTTSYTS